MGELEILARRMSLKGDDYAITRRNVSAASGEYVKQITGQRVGLFVYSTIHSASGELCWGKHGVTALTGFPIPRLTMVEIPVTEEAELWFVASTGQQGGLAILELER